MSHVIDVCYLIKVILSFNFKGNGVENVQILLFGKIKYVCIEKLILTTATKWSMQMTPEMCNFYVT